MSKVIRASYFNSMDMCWLNEDEVMMIIIGSVKHFSLFRAISAVVTPSQSLCGVCTSGKTYRADAQH